MNCLEFMRLRQSMNQLPAEMNFSDENVVITDAVPIHIDLFRLMYQFAINNGEITGEITSGRAVIGWSAKDGKIHTSNSDNHFLEDGEINEAES